MMKLYEIAYARSGDKGDNANIGVIAYNEEGYNTLVECLTASKVYNYFEALGVKEVKRYLLPNLHAVNFVLYGVLGGGGSESLRLDSQGKALGQALLEMDVDVDAS